MKTKNFDYFAYIDSIMKKLKLSPDADDSTKTHIRTLVEDMVDDRIVELVLSAFTPTDYEKVEQLLKENPEMDSNEAILLVSESIDGMPERLDKGLEGLRDEFIHYSDFADKVIK